MILNLHGQGRNSHSLLPDTSRKQLPPSLVRERAPTVFCGLCAEQIHEIGQPGRLRPDGLGSG